MCSIQALKLASAAGEATAYKWEELKGKCAV